MVKNEIPDEYQDDETQIDGECIYIKGIHNELLAMRVIDFSEELIEKLREQIKEIHLKLKYWMKATPEKVWYESLVDLENSGIYEYCNIKFDDIDDTGKKETNKNDLNVKKVIKK